MKGTRKIKKTIWYNGYNAILYYIIYNIYSVIQYICYSCIVHIFMYQFNCVKHINYINDITKVYI